MLVINCASSSELCTYMSIYGDPNKSTKESLSSSADVDIYFFMNLENRREKSSCIPICLVGMSGLFRTVALEWFISLAVNCIPKLYIDHIPTFLFLIPIFAHLFLHSFALFTSCLGLVLHLCSGKNRVDALANILIKLALQ